MSADLAAENLRLCLEWVQEREAVRIRKESGIDHPWTNDPNIGAYRFCNVRREDDRGTIWIRENIRERFAGHPCLWWMLCAARQINWPATLATLIGDPAVIPAGRKYPGAWPADPDLFSPQAMADALNDIASTGAKVFTGAYIITAPSTKGAKKTDLVALETLGMLWRDRERIGPLFDQQPSMRMIHGKLIQYHGWGPFLSYQAVVDMRFTPLLSGASDVATWAAAGPGTLRGLNRVHGRRLDYPLHQVAALTEMRRLWPLIMERTGVEMDFSDVPNVMCETDKFIRVRNSEGKPRALYVPGRGA
jgi:hypothetical protein